MKVLYVTSEALPYAASGGLGDVAGSLPQAIRQRIVGLSLIHIFVRGCIFYASIWVVPRVIVTRPI